KDEIDAFLEKEMETYRQNYRVLTPSGDSRWIEDRTSVVRDDTGKKTHHQGILVDITERTLAEKALATSEEKYRRIIETTGQGFVMMDENLIILDVNEAYCRMLGYSRLELVGKSPFDLATPEFRRFLESNRRQLLASEDRDFEGNMVAKSGRTVPVLIHGNTLRDDGGRSLGNIAFVTDLTQQKQSLLLAAEVQRHLLPQTGPRLDGLEVAGRSLPCDEIGGDYFDFITRGEGGSGPVCLVVGDITGHGVDAALFMTASRSFLRLRASQPGSNTQIISDMNRHLSSDADVTSRFMTLFFMVVEPEQHRIRWVRAGHDPAMVYSPEDDRFHELKGSGIALGLNPNYRYEENSYHDLTAGQIIAVGTDGIWEARNPDGKMFGKDRLCRIIRENQKESADTILNRVYDALSRFQDGSRTEDDMTLVIAKATPPAAP
ncbi:MAG: SpoIIE family protein phosphatase, partial [Desulfobacterales bacterium]